MLLMMMPRAFERLRRVARYATRAQEINGVYTRQRYTFIFDYAIAAD